MNIYTKIAVLFWALQVASCTQNSLNSAPDVSIGIIADCQYHPGEHRRERHFNLSAGKLEQAVATLNEQSIDWSIHLGDFIDKDFESYQTLLPIWHQLDQQGYHVLGNHDFSVEESLKLTVPDTLSMPARYHDFSQNNWRFIVIDGNDLSLYAYPKASEQHLASAQAFEDFQSTLATKKKLHTYNGALGKKQLAWLKTVLADAEKNNQQVVLFSHFPVYPANAHNLWNDSEIVTLLEQYPNVFAWFNGHNHGGNYGFKNGIHYVTFKAMVNTTKNAFSVANFYPDKIEILGFGRQQNMVLPRKKARSSYLP
ncbi:metallophosphoesterase [Thalassotalea sp. PLHSN55]|uniref:metallophosphoesterase n=1 Tax=Thalassotalea sp. PLHSN55 TaxID=3435888 RepID=UPI003F84268B